MNNILDIHGHSGCAINIIERDNHLYIKKSTNDSKYLDRLYAQGLKQLNDSNNQNIVAVPHIYDIQKNENETYILMDYIYAKNFIDYFEYATKVDIDIFINIFIDYINNELSKCEIKTISSETFINKFKSVNDNCLKNILLNNKSVIDILDKCKQIFQNLPEKIELPVNICHGDLTFSNILFTNNKFYFIDYLDSFIETPIQDIVKLRQDTKYFWSIYMTEKSFDKIRIKMIFDYIDQKIHSYFKTNEYYSNWYYYLQLMNILRILPYVKEEKIRDLLVNILYELLEYGTVYTYNAND